MRATRARAQTCFEHTRAYQRAAMTTDLDQIFAGVTGRRAMDRHHSLIDQLAGLINNLSKVLNLGLELRRLLFGAKYLVRDCNRLRAGNSDERNRAFARGSGNRRDGFARDHVLVLRSQLGRSFDRTFFSAAMHFRFCSIVPMEIRIHSGKL